MRQMWVLVFGRRRRGGTLVPFALVVQYCGVNVGTGFFENKRGQKCIRCLWNEEGNKYCVKWHKGKNVRHPPFMLNDVAWLMLVPGVMERRRYTPENCFGSDKRVNTGEEGEGERGEDREVAGLLWLGTGLLRVLDGEEDEDANDNRSSSCAF